MLNLRSFIRFSSPIRTDSIRNFSRQKFYLRKNFAQCLLFNNFSDGNCTAILNDFSHWNSLPRRYFSSKNDPNGSDGSSSVPPDDPTESPSVEEPAQIVTEPWALTPFNIPEKYPIVPILVINKHPVFPGFAKILEVNCA